MKPRHVWSAGLLGFCALFITAAWVPAADVEVEIQKTEKFVVINNFGSTQLVVQANGHAAFGTAPGSHRLALKSGAQGVSAATLHAENTHTQGLALVTTTESSDANMLLRQRGSGDFLYCDAWDGAINWRRPFRILKDGSVDSDGMLFSTGVVVRGSAAGLNIYNTTEDQGGLHFFDAQADGSQYARILYNSGSPNKLGLYVDSIFPALQIFDTQNVGIGIDDPGSHRFYVKGGSSGAGGSALFVENIHGAGIATSSKNNSTDVNTLIAQHGAGDFLYCDAWDGDTNWRRMIRLQKDGTVECKVLTITGGSDLAEPFDVHPTDDMTPEPGMVLSIDPERIGQLRVSQQAYDRCVAGIVSGAGGVHPGVLLQQEGTVASGQHPVALTGRVYCWADASTGPILPGDLLTTSDVPGHAMKARDSARSQGAILGKAMSPLSEGQGLVLTLVTLQ